MIAQRHGGGGFPQWVSAGARRQSRPMDIQQATPLLGGLSPTQFMRRHWQKKPLLVRQAWPGVQAPIDRSALFDLAAAEGVESRLLTAFDGSWKLRHGPFSRRQIPPVKKPHWTLLLQGLDLHWQPAHAMLQAFRFLPEARLDDLMISYASDGGGVGPHLDSYDVFLLQVHGQRRWRIGPVADRSLVPGLPVRILANFEPTEEYLLEPGDMLYLPPLWGHDGVAEGECMTCSIGFRAASETTLAQELLHQIADDMEPPAADATGHETGRNARRIYRDAAQPATANPGRLPDGLRAFARAALQRALRDAGAVDRALGSLMTEPKPQVWFDTGAPLPAGSAAVLDRRSRMAYDDAHVFINGEAFRAGGRDARLMRQLADARRLTAAEVARLSADARALLDDWAEAGWVQAEG
jgi:50S ribosomal protein L16 3-hydroxylase